MTIQMQQFDALFTDRASRPPPGFAPEGPQRDPDAMVGANAQPQRGLAGLRLGIVYRDEEGALSRRLVRVKRLDRHGGGIVLTGHCELRAALRSFALDRVQAIISYATGRAIDGRAFFAPLLPLADGREAATPLPEACGDGLCVLHYFAHADEAADEDEWRMIDAYLVWRLRAKRLPVNGQDRWLATYRNCLVPDKEDFEAAFFRLLEEDRAHAARVVECAAKIVLADGSAHAEERDRLRALMSLLEDDEFMNA